MVRIVRPRQSGPEIQAVEPLEETAGYDEYVRWCGRTGAARPPPTRLAAERRQNLAHGASRRVLRGSCHSPGWGVRKHESRLWVTFLRPIRGFSVPLTIPTACAVG